MRIKTYNFRFERWLNITTLDFLPIDATEKQMDTNIFLARFTAAQSFLWIFR